MSIRDILRSEFGGCRDEPLWGPANFVSVFTSDDHGHAEYFRTSGWQLFDWTNLLRILGYMWFRQMNAFGTN